MSESGVVMADCCEPQYKQLGDKLYSIEFLDKYGIKTFADLVKAERSGVMDDVGKVSIATLSAIIDKHNKTSTMKFNVKDIFVNEETGECCFNSQNDIDENIAMEKQMAEIFVEMNPMSNSQEIVPYLKELMGGLKAEYIKGMKDLTPPLTIHNKGEWVAGEAIFQDDALIIDIVYDFAKRVYFEYGRKTCYSHKEKAIRKLGEEMCMKNYPLFILQGVYYAVKRQFDNVRHSNLNLARQTTIASQGKLIELWWDGLTDVLGTMWRA